MSITRKEFPSADALATAAAIKFIVSSASAIELRGRFVVALSGGSTPKAVFEKLASKAFSDQVEWQNVFVFWGDERCVPASSAESNSGNARRVLLDRVPIPEANIFAVQTNGAAEDAATEYEIDIKNFFLPEVPRFDLILLGLGADGHTASLFPGSEVLQEAAAGVRAVAADKQRGARITFTAPLINLAREKLFLVSGAGKREILERVFSTSEGEYPAQLIRDAEWFTFTASV